MTFGEYLRQLREKNNFRQCDLAKKIGVSTVYVCDIEKGRRYPPDLDKLKIWIEQLQLTSDEATNLYDLAGEARNSPAPDILAYLSNNIEAKHAIRRIMKKTTKYDWNAMS